MHAHGGPSATVVNGTKPFNPSLLERHPRRLSRVAPRRRAARVRRRCPTASSPCPATGSAPRSSRRRSQVLDAVGDFAFEEHLFGGASIDAHGTALTDEVLAACRGADAVLLAAVGGPKWDTTDPDAPRPEQGLLGLRKGLGLYANLRPGPPAAGALRRQPAAPRRSSSAPTCSSCASSPAASTSARRRAPPTRATRPLRLQRARRSSASRASRSASARSRGDERRQGQRARDQPPVARGRHRACTPRVPEHRARARARRQRRDEARLRAAPLRRDPHREHVRRHPQRRGGDAHRLDRDAAERLARRGRHARACSSPSTARRPTSPARGSPTRWRCSCRAAMMLRHGLDLPDAAASVESAVDRALDAGAAHPRPRRHREHGRGHAGRARTPLTQETVREARGPHLDERRVRRMGGREGPRTHARPALRHRRLRGRPLLRHRDRPGGVPPRRPHRPALQVGRAVLHADPVRPRAAAPGDARADRARTACASATSARSCSAATARWACSRSTRRSTSASPSGSGPPTSARRARPTACARRSRAGGASAPTA